MIMGRNKRTNFQDNGADSESESISIPKKSKKATADSAPRAVKSSGLEQKNSSESNLKKCRGQNIYTDSSSCSESDNEKNSVKKSERSASNSESDSDSDSDSSVSDSSRGSKPEDVVSKPVKNSVTNLNPVPAAKSYEESTAKSSGSDSYHSDTEEEDKKRRRKQKEMLKQQLSKKGKRGSPRKQDNFLLKTDVKVEIEDDVKDDDEGGEAQGNTDDMLDWPESDILELIRRMEVQIPEGDTQKFDSRAARLDWDKIAFGNYSKQECHDTWNQISKRIRRFRKLREVLEDAKEWAKKPWTNFYRGSKKNRHPDMPSKPLSAYMIYYLEQKDKAIEENKGADLMQISKIITEKYKNLSDKEREKYSQKAAKEKRNFDEKIAEFYREHPECEPSTQSKANSRESMKGPKKPHPPFKMFFQEELKKVVVDGVADRKSAEEIAREKWRSFGDKKKAEWIKMSLEDLNRYEREVKAFKQKNPDYTAPNYNKNLLNKEERLILERLSGKPVKPPNSAYSLFSRHMLQSNTEVKSKAPKLRMAEISRKWKELSSTEKHKYEQMVKELQEDYKLKLQKYLKSLTPEERQRELDSVKKEKRKKEKLSTNKSKKVNINSKKGKKDSRCPFYENEPKAPPLSVYEFFVEKFLADKPPGMSKEARLKQAQECWDKLPESKKDALKDEHVVMRQKYITEFSAFLESLSKQELLELTAMKAKMESTGQHLQRRNGTLTDSNDESDEGKYESSSDGSDSDDSDSVKSRKNGSESGRSKSSSSEDSDG